MLMAVAARRPDGSFLPAVEKEISRPSVEKDDQKMDSFLYPSEYPSGYMTFVYIPSS